jgi:hypothetical protein
LDMRRREYQDPSYTLTQAFSDEKRNWAFAFEKIASVVAAAAHHMGDTKTRDLFSTVGESHSAGMLSEHLRLVSGQEVRPDASHSPSDYSAFEMDLFEKVRVLSPQEFRAWLESHQYGNPTRIEALTAHRPKHLAEIARWNREGYVPLKRGASLLTVLHSAFERRRIAELAHDETTAKRLTEIGQGFSRQLTENSKAYTLVFAFESVVFER